MPIYLICIYVLIAMLIVLALLCTYILIRNRIKSTQVTIENLMQKKSSLYIKYDLNNKEITINNYTYLNIDVSKHIVKISQKEDFLENVKYITKNKDEKFSYVEKSKDLCFNLSFSFRDKIDDVIILRCDYDVEKLIEPVELKSIEEVKTIHNDSDSKSAVFYYLNIKDFNSINQRYGQECGDYILEVVKSRLLKIESKNFRCCYLGSDQFTIYYNKNVSKKKALKIIKSIYKKITKSIDIGYINVDLVFGVGICIGKYDDLEEFIKCAYIASDYAKKRQKYNIVIYNETMKLEESIIENCDKELKHILEKKEININYSPVYYYDKSKFIGYISQPIFTNQNVSYDKLKSVAIQEDKIDQLMNIIINHQLVSYIKKRPNKRSKLFINLKLEDLSTFLEVYLSNASYSDCKIVICLNVKKGYEMINKFSNISSNISKIIEEGIDFALEINYSNMYDYDYILKNAKYLILDSGIIANINNALVKNQIINILELANNYELELFSTEVKEYVQFENLLRYDVHYFAGEYFGKNVKKLNELEATKTRIFAKLNKDSQKNKKIR